MDTKPTDLDRDSLCVPSCDYFRKYLTKTSKLNKKKTTLAHDLRSHLDDCLQCWREYNFFRWEQAAKNELVLELTEFLGDDFEYGVDSSWKLAEEWKKIIKITPETIHNFYKTTPWYVYNLAIWEASGQRANYVSRIQPLIESCGIKSVLDFGAGIGNDTFKLCDFGIETTAYEINRKCIEFMKWKVQRRTHNLPIIIDSLNKATTYDMVWAMDVLEHLYSPMDELKGILKKTRVFVYDFEHSGNSGERHPFHFEHDPVNIEKEWCRLGFKRVFIEDLNPKFVVFRRNE